MLGSLEPEAPLTLQTLERKSLFFHVALGIGARHPLGLQTCSIGQDVEKTGLIELRFNVLFLVCTDKTNNGSHTVLPKVMTETDSGKQTGSG